jgi:hypothetical protein
MALIVPHHGQVAGPDLLESARPPDGRLDRGATAPARPVGARLLLWSLAAVALVVVAGQVVSGGTPAAQHATSATPLDQRGPSHPLVRLDQVPPGWRVVGRVDGYGAQVRVASMQWAAGTQVALLVRCPTGPAQLWINFAGHEPPRATPCTPTATLVSSTDMPALLVSGGVPVPVRAADQTHGSGAWVVAVLARGPGPPWTRGA